MHCENIEITRHAFSGALNRGIMLADALDVVKNGEIIAKYLDTKPCPCFLILGFTKNGPLHVVVAKEMVSEECWLVTLYFPDPAIWNEDFKSKKNKT